MITYNSYEYFRNLSLLIFPYNAKERVMASFAAYFDESGTHGDSRILTLAGYVAKVEQWVEFSREWDELLKQENLTHFHMSKFEARQGEFAGWDNERRLRVQQRLIGIIKRRVNFGIFCAVNLVDYEETMTEWGRDAFGSPYSFCVKLCLAFVSLISQKYNRTEPIAYFIEHGAGYNHEISESVRATFANGTMRNLLRLGSLTFIDKKAALPIQAADLLAYEVWKDASNRFVTNEDKKRPERKSFRSLREILHQGSYWDREELLRENAREQTNFEVRTPEATLIFKFNPEDETGPSEIIIPTF
jgi:hypothetical protein